MLLRDVPRPMTDTQATKFVNKTPRPAKRVGTGKSPVAANRKADVQQRKLLGKHYAAKYGCSKRLGDRT